MDTEIAWDAVAADFTQRGIACTAVEIQNPDWCARALARLGYSLQITTVTSASYLAKIKRIGKIDPASEIAQKHLAILEAQGPFFTYQLEGPMYPERGSHPSPLCANLQQAAAMALYNMAVLLEPAQKS